MNFSSDLRRKSCIDMFPSDSPSLLFLPRAGSGFFLFEKFAPKSPQRPWRDGVGSGIRLFSASWNAEEGRGAFKDFLISLGALDLFETPMFSLLQVNVSRKSIISFNQEFVNFWKNKNF